MQGVSIGFTAGKYHRSKDVGRALNMGVDFEEVAVHEASIVTFPANSQAGIKAMADRREFFSSLDKKEQDEKALEGLTLEELKHLQRRNIIGPMRELR